MNRNRKNPDKRYEITPGVVRYLNRANNKELLALATICIEVIHNRSGEPIENLVKDVQTFAQMAVDSGEAQKAQQEGD